MCVLCGEMIMTVHWTDQPLHDVDYRRKRTVVVGESQRERLRLRLKRVAIANKLLAYYGLSLRDWNGSRYLLSSRNGLSKVIYDLGGMWSAAAKLAGRQLDPLDPAFLASLQKEAGSADRGQ